MAFIRSLFLFTCGAVCASLFSYLNVSISTLPFLKLVFPEEHHVYSTCQSLSSAVSAASAVHFPGSPQYDAGIAHWIGSSTENATCTVEPGSTADLSLIIRMLGSRRVPFGIKGGGRTAHLGFSSTTGVQIAMTRFTDLKYNQDTGIVDVGAGLAWDNVYGYLKQYGVSVAGGRVSGVGVAGFLLGGGLSWKTNMYGLGSDTVTAFEIVLPDGTLTVASEDQNDDLFFALKGGMNNFGIVTKFSIRTFPQTDIWGGVITVPEPSIDAANEALAAYAEEVVDPKAAINAEYIYYAGNLLIRILVFYDAPSAKEGVFDRLLALPGVQVEVGTTDFVAFNTHGLPFTGGERVTFGMAPIQKFTKPFLHVVAKETAFWGRKLSPAFVMNIVEVFLPTYLSHGSPSAYPDDRSVYHQPISSYFAWDDIERDQLMHASVNEMDENLIAAAVAEGQEWSNFTYYGNIASAETSLEKLYGRNLERLREIKKKYDPQDVMGLAGGYKL